MPQRFAGRTVLLFGGGSTAEGHTNGSAAALSYAREGAHVVIVDRSASAAELTRAAIAAEGGSAAVEVADVTESAEVARVVAGLDTVDVLHNNVGVTRMGLPPDLDPADWQSSLDVNLGSVFLTAKHVLPVMQRQGRGAIVNVSSLAALRATGYPYPAYSAAKAAVNQLTSVLAVEYARHGIRVNAVAPGLIDTPLIYRDIAGEYSSVDEMVAARGARTPMGRMGTPWEVASAALFLASEDASFVTGVILPVDGGQHVAV